MMETNKGTHAGGENTNKKAAPLENRLRNTYSNAITATKRLQKKTWKYNIEEVELNGNTYIRAPESSFPRWGKNFGDEELKKVKPLNGAKWPDDCFINKVSKTINWAEAKVQGGSGSVCEKLQSGTKKIRNLQRRFPDWKINYYYVLDITFKNLCPQEIADLDEDGIPYIFDTDPEFEKKLLNLIK